MNKQFQSKILSVTGAKELYEMEMIQKLWSGYGKIVRYGLKGGDFESVVVKHVRLPDRKNHPRGWNSDLSHLRKLKSYEVEMAWYKNWGEQCEVTCRIPKCLGLERQGDEVLMILEDLDASGYSMRKTSVNDKEMRACLSWLANFHACFLGKEPKDLWEVGTYWHLETRPDELEVLEDQALKSAADSLDKKLRNSPYQTFVHGDAKLANFCFSNEGTKVAAVDFQYVGGGCGMKDVAYFIGSCLYEDECEKQETELLDYYFACLKEVIFKKQLPFDANAIEKNWRELYPVAWTDFHRFMKGWSPGHWKIHSYSERLAREVVAQLNKEDK